MKLYHIAIVASAAIFTFSGCSSKSEITYSSKDKGLAGIKVFNPPAKFATNSSAERASLSAVMQIAAEQTLSTGNRYFAIVKPDKVSNTNGSMMNTMKEFIDKCYPSTVSLNLNKCGVAYVGNGSLLVRMSKNTSDKYLMYDANEVLSELKKTRLL
ncbi:MAG: hypothetical protein PHE67_03510 [Campylobacterales bacterium]|nr:hypothetical protein [Campylobacterales bacterium]